MSEYRMTPAESWAAAFLIITLTAIAAGAWTWLVSRALSLAYRQWKARTREMFYIQNYSNCGNCLLWWRPDGHGYTLNLKEAWKVDKARAERICRDRPKEDFPRAVAEMDALAEHHVMLGKLVCP